MKGLLTAIFLLVSVGYSLGKEVCKVHSTTYEYCQDGYYCCHFSKCCKTPTTTNGGAVAGIVIGSFAGVCLIIVVVVVVIKCSNKHKRSVQNGNVVIVSRVPVDPMYGTPQGQQFGMTPLPCHSRPEQPLHVPPQGPWKGATTGADMDGMPPQYSRH